MIIIMRKILIVIFFLSLLLVFGCEQKNNSNYKCPVDGYLNCGARCALNSETGECEPINNSCDDQNYMKWVRENCEFKGVLE